MSKLNDLELELRSWVPRPPSPKLEKRLFAHPTQAPSIDESAGSEAVVPRFNLSWLAPATLALLLMGIMFNQRNLSSFSAGSSSRAMIAVALSNQSAAAWLPGSFAHDQNTIPAETFEWTNRNRSNSSLDSFSAKRETN